MKRTSLLSAALVLVGNVVLLAADPPAVKIPPAEAASLDALKASTRHGEWADIALPGSDVKIHTWVVYPERADKAPVVIVIHEIFGMSDWVRATTDQLAAEGFIAIAPDLLSGKGPDGGGTEALQKQSANAVGQAIQKLTVDEDTKMLNAVRDYALALPSATGKCGCIGFCWGGGTSFSYASQQPKLNAAVVCYGVPAKALESINCPVLGLYGGADARITATVEATKAKMAELKKSYDPHVFENAGHGFFRQQTGRDGSNLKAATAGWAEAIAFLKKHLETPAK